jgi:type I restriction enzyme S subunit
MASNWTIASLEDCVAVIIDYRGKTPQKTSSGVPLITAKVVKGGRIGTPDEFIAEEDYSTWMRRGMPQAGDVIVTTEAPLGEVAQLGGGRVALAQRLVALRGKPHILDNTYLKFLMQSEGVQAQLRARSSGTTVFGIKQSELRKITLTIPSIPEQHAIAHALGTLDDKIELNWRMNETLEAMAQALFKSWFVDFDPVRAKAEGRDPGLSRHLADLFPDSFEQPGLGEIPKGWRITPLPEVVEVNPLRTVGRGEVAPYLDMANMPTEGHSPDAVVDRAFSSGMRFVNGDTLVARITPCLENGKTAYVDFLRDGQVGWGSTEFIVLRPKPPLPTEYAYCLARSAEFRDFAIQSMTGSSGRQRVPSDSLAQFEIAVPSEKVAGKFSYLVEPLFARAKAASEQCRVLAALRDALLPRLISGEIRLADIEGRLGGSHA